MAADSIAALWRQGGAMQDQPKNDTATIMVVDDDQRNVRLMESILRSICLVESGALYVLS